MNDVLICPFVFREYDIRGIAGTELSPAFAKLLGRAYATYIRNSATPSTLKIPMTIAVGQDCRLSSREYATALISGLCEEGLNVIDLGVCPTPLTYFSIFSQELDGGIMVTGSHNPANYNGFKICHGKNTIYGEQIQVLRCIMEKLVKEQTIPSTLPLGKISSFAIIPSYIEYLTQHTPSLKKKKIVLDAGNGTASTVAPLLFQQLGAEVIPLYCELDGRFPNHHPDPTVPENLKDLIAQVLAHQADFGLAFDGDADRIGLVDNQGNILYGDEIMILLARGVLKNHPNATILSEVKSSYRLYNDIAAKGGQPIMWKTGHIFFADRYFGYDDAIYAGVRIYEIISGSESPLSTLLTDLPQTIVTPEIRVDCDESKKFKLVEETQKRIPKHYPITDIDGIRVDFGDGWGLLRASNTQPALVLRFEASSTARLMAIRSILETALEQAALAIQHTPLELHRSASHT
jgi:phosphomannomutase / phosphoglucomutase